MQVKDIKGLPHKCTTTATYISYAYAHDDRFELGEGDIVLGYDNNDKLWVLKKLHNKRA